METGKKFIQVIINSEEDLPKKTSIYNCHLKEQKISEIIFNLEDPSDVSWWMQYIDWYLIEQPEPEQRTAEEILKKHWKINEGRIIQFDEIYEAMEEYASQSTEVKQ